MSAPTTSTPSFLQTIEADALAAVTKVKDEIVALWNYEEPIFVAELKSLEHQLFEIASSGLVTILGQVASGAITSTESLGALVTHTYQTAIAQGLPIVIQDAQAAARQIGAAAVTVAGTGKPPAA